MHSADAALHPYRSGLYEPVRGPTKGPLRLLEGELPRELNGDFARNGSNARFPPQGRWHWFDGDGMIHRVRFDDGHAEYASAWVETRAFRAETEAGRSLWGTSTERPDFAHTIAPMKNTANTDVVYFGGKLLALWWLAGDVYAVDRESLETVGEERFGGAVRSMSAHPKVDPRTGELVFFDYQAKPPFLRAGAISPEGVATWQTDVPLDGPRLQHDMAITENHVLLFDTSLQWDPAELARGRTRVCFFKQRPSRIGVLRRGADGATTRWFDTSAFYMYHTINAWEDGGRIHLIGCRITDPLARPGAPDTVPTIGFLRLEPRLHEWTLDLATGVVHESPLDDTLGEFPRIDDRYLGTRHRYTFLPTFAPEATLLFRGLDVHDHQTKTKESLLFPEGSFGDEVVFAPRSATSGEAEGWLLTFVHTRGIDATELWVMDARDVSKGPRARLALPARVPIGFHADYLPGYRR